MHIKEFFANLIAEAKRLPWWAWLLIAAAVYLGYRLLSGGGGQNDSSGDPLGDILDTSGPASSGDNSSSSGENSSSGDNLGDTHYDGFSGYNFSNGDYSSGEDNVTHTASRVIQQGWDIHDAALSRQAAANAAQAARSRQQGEDLRVANAEAAARRTAANQAQIARSRQQGLDLRKANNPPKASQSVTDATRQATGRGQYFGVGGGPDGHDRDKNRVKSQKSQPIYTMRSGEDLYSVSDKLGVPADDLYAANRDRIDAAIREAGLTGMGIYALPVIGDGLDLVIPAAAL